MRKSKRKTVTKIFAVFCDLLMVIGRIIGAVITSAISKESGKK